jgi:Ca2+-binding EF-hand superfamily protein
MKTMGEPLTETELDIMMKDADKNKDGKIDYEGND